MTEDVVDDGDAQCHNIPNECKGARIRNPKLTRDLTCPEVHSPMCDAVGDCKEGGSTRMGGICVSLFLLGVQGMDQRAIRVSTRGGGEGGRGYENPLSGVCMLVQQA